MTPWSDAVTTHTYTPIGMRIQRRFHPCAETVNGGVVQRKQQLHRKNDQETRSNVQSRLIIY